MIRYSISNNNLTLVENAKGEWRLTSMKTEDRIVTFSTLREARRFLIPVRRLAPGATLRVTEVTSAQ